MHVMHEFICIKSCKTCNEREKMVLSFKHSSQYSSLKNLETLFMNIIMRIALQVVSNVNDGSRFLTLNK